MNEGQKRNQAIRDEAFNYRHELGNKAGGWLSVGILDEVEVGFITGAHFGYSLAEERIEELEQENARLKEAARWIDRTIEVPSNQDVVLVKSHKECFATAYWHGYNSGFILYGDDAYVDFGHVTHWRPID